MEGSGVLFGALITSTIAERLVSAGIIALLGCAGMTVFPLPLRLVIGAGNFLANWLVFTTTEVALTGILRGVVGREQMTLSEVESKYLSSFAMFGVMRGVGRILRPLGHRIVARYISAVGGMMASETVTECIGLTPANHLSWDRRLFHSILAATQFEVLGAGARPVANRIAAPYVTQINNWGERSRKRQEVLVESWVQGARCFANQSRYVGRMFARGLVFGPAMLMTGATGGLGEVARGMGASRLEETRNTANTAIINRSDAFACDMIGGKQTTREISEFGRFFWMKNRHSTEIQRIFDQIVTPKQMRAIRALLTPEQLAIYDSMGSLTNKQVNRFFDSLTERQFEYPIEIIDSVDQRSRLWDLYVSQRDPIHWNYRTRFYDRKYRESSAIAALVHQIGITSNTLVDVAGGSGDLARTISQSTRVRNLLVVDYSERAGEYVDAINHRFDQSVRFQRINIFEELIPNGTWVAKHPCGMLYDAVIHQWANNPNSPELLIVSCCQGKASGFANIDRYGFDAGSHTDVNIWRELTAMSDWSTARGSNNSRQNNPFVRLGESIRTEIGNLAMLGLDMLRANYLRSRGFQVQLFRIPDVIKGNVIIARRSDRPVSVEKRFEQPFQTFDDLMMQANVLHYKLRKLADVHRFNFQGIRRLPKGATFIHETNNVERLIEILERSRDAADSLKTQGRELDENAHN